MSRVFCPKCKRWGDLEYHPATNQIKKGFYQIVHERKVQFGFVMVDACIFSEIPRKPQVGR